MSVTTVAAVAAGAFASTNIDNLGATTAQVALAAPERTRRVIQGQMAGFAVFLGLAAAATQALGPLPDRLLGLLGLVPLAMGARGLVALAASARHRAQPPGQPSTDPSLGTPPEPHSPQSASPATDLRRPRRLGRFGFPRRPRQSRPVRRPPGAPAAFLITLAASGDNLAVTIPILHGAGLAGGLLTVGVYSAGDLLSCAGALLVGRHGATRRVLLRAGALVQPFAYLAIGVALVLRAGTIPGLP